MLYEDFNVKRRLDGEAVFTSRLDEEIVRSLNPRFELRDYQKEALGRLEFYFEGYRGRKHPTQLLFNMATGSGKTLIMAANILQLYKKGYRNFIFFVNRTTIIDKTRDNFLNPQSSKYLFADQIKFGEREIQVMEVDNFENSCPDDINIVFTTIQGLHSQLNTPRENALTYEDFEDKEIVMLSDEAHHINTLTKLKSKAKSELSLFDTLPVENTALNGLNKGEKEEVKSWEGTVERIFRANHKNILLEFTATIDLKDEAISAKYKDKILFQYDLKQFRLDKFSKEIEVLQADVEPLERAIQAIIVSQYRRKIAEKSGNPLKPVLMFKSSHVNPPSNPNPKAVVSSEFREKFHAKIKNLKPENINRFRKNRDTNGILQKAFNYFDANGISMENLITELQNDFDETKCLSVDSQSEKEEKQVLVNTLEAEDNEIRAVFAVEMLNEGWDVLNLFDIVRLYDKRDGKWKGNKYEPGSTTMSEAQLIGRGARYFPFKLDDSQEMFKRKYDDTPDNELRALEQLHYHSAHNPDYIYELKRTLSDLGIIPEKQQKQLPLRFKDSFKKTEFWKNGKVFSNELIKNPKEDIYSLDDAEVRKEHLYEIPTGVTREEHLFEEMALRAPETARTSKEYRLPELGEHVVRGAMDLLDFYRFDVLENYFPHLASCEDFIRSPKYLADITVEVVGRRTDVISTSQRQKLDIVLRVLKDIADDVRSNTAEQIGSRTFYPRDIKDVFKDKILNLDEGDPRADRVREADIAAYDWYAQNALYGTSEEEEFTRFMEKVIDELQRTYSSVALIRNERHLAIYEFEEGRRFEPDFVLMLRNGHDGKITTHQVFIESKGDQPKDRDGRFEKSGEGWKQDFLLEMEEEAELDLQFSNGRYRLIGLPFYNKQLEKEFESAFAEKVLS